MLRIVKTEPQSKVCPAEFLRLCDTTDPPIGDEMSADDAANRATFYILQRDECAKLNEAKLSCIIDNKTGKKSK